MFLKCFMVRVYLKHRTSKQTVRLFISSLATVICNHRRTQDFTLEGIHVVRGRAREPGGRKSPVGSEGKAPVTASGDRVPQKLKQNVH